MILTTFGCLASGEDRPVPSGGYPVRVVSPALLRGRISKHLQWFARLQERRPSGSRPHSKGSEAQLLRASRGWEFRWLACLAQIIKTPITITTCTW